MKRTGTANRSKGKGRLIPVCAAVAVILALAAVLLPRLRAGDSGDGSAAQAELLASGQDVVIQTGELSETASFFDYDAGGTTVELFAVVASDGTVRLALNTCQVCNGSPYAYFVQEGDDFICQNCGNRFSSTQVGVASGGCNPVPVTAEDYTLQGDSIIVPADLLENNAARFANWKQF